MAELRILDGDIGRLKTILGDLSQFLDLKAGDTVLALETEENIAVGREVFEALIKNGWLGYSVAKGGVAGRRVMEFDPLTERVVLFGPIAGG